MTIDDILAKMIAYPEQSAHDIDHLLQVWTYARTIGQMEHIDADTQLILETAAIVHDIACPLCRKKYGNTNGKKQEEEGMPLARDFLTGCGLDGTALERVVYLVGHHHTFEGIEGIDWQILVEADYIANAVENEYSRENVTNFIERIMKTESGIKLANAVLLS